MRSELVGADESRAAARAAGGRLSHERRCDEHERLKVRNRHYQIEANTAIEEAIAKRKRQMLLAMATGTGKTFTLVNEVYRLLKSRVGRRVLFLVDRRALAAQAVRAFASFEPEPSKKFDKIYEVYSQRLAFPATASRTANCGSSSSGDPFSP